LVNEPASGLFGGFSIDPAELTRFTESLRAAPLVLLYEGLPHQTWEPVGLANEILHKHWVSIHGFPFYDPPLAIQDADQDTLRELLSDPGLYREGAGVKLCGGFHPDFSVVWKDAEQLSSLHLCTGCDEAKFTKGDRSVHCGIQSGCWTCLWDIWRPCARQRPPSGSMESAWEAAMRDERMAERLKDRQMGAQQEAENSPTRFQQAIPPTTA
jgi:hypothetical protein